LAQNKNKECQNTTTKNLQAARTSITKIENGEHRLVERLGLLRREDTRRQLMGSEAGARPINTEHEKTNGQLSRQEEIKTVARSAPGAEKERTGGIRRDE
jgi:hypothetical protein